MTWWPFSKPAAKPVDIATVSDTGLVDERDRIIAERQRHIEGVHAANERLAACETELKRRFLKTKQVNVLPSYGVKKVKNDQSR